jgi:hypothetical protein
MASDDDIHFQVTSHNKMGVDSGRSDDEQKRVKERCEGAT